MVLAPLVRQSPEETSMLGIVLAGQYGFLAGGLCGKNPLVALGKAQASHYWTEDRERQKRLMPKEQRRSVLRQLRALKPVGHAWREAWP